MRTHFQTRQSQDQTSTSQWMQRPKECLTLKVAQAFSLQKFQTARTQKLKMINQGQVNTQMFSLINSKKRLAQQVKLENQVSTGHLARQATHSPTQHKELISGQMRSMLHTQSKLTSRIQALVNTQSPKRKETILRVNSSLKRPCLSLLIRLKKGIATKK